MRLVDDKFRREMEKSKLGHLPAGIRWEKQLREVTSVRRGTVTVKMEFKDQRFPRNLV